MHVYLFFEENKTFLSSTIDKNNLISAFVLDSHIYFLETAKAYIVICCTSSCAQQIQGCCELKQSCGIHRYHSFLCICNTDYGWFDPSSYCCTIKIQSQVRKKCCDDKLNHLSFTLDSTWWGKMEKQRGRDTVDRRVSTMMLFVAQWAETHTVSTQHHVWWLDSNLWFQKLSVRALNLLKHNNSLKTVWGRTSKSMNVCCCPWIIIKIALSF